MGRSIRWAASFPCLLLACSPPAMADDPAAPPRAATTLIARVLPDGWTMEIKGSRLVLRPGKQPLFVNTIGIGGQKPNETLEDFYQHNKVKFDYQICARLEPKLSFEDVRSLIKENLAVHWEIQQLERSPLAEMGKGDISFRPTAEGQRLSGQRDHLARSFRPVPAGYVGDVSVFIDTTFLGYAEFFREEEQRECEGVRQRILDQLTPYRREAPVEPASPKPADKD